MANRPADPEVSRGTYTGEIKSPPKEDGGADPEALSDQMIQGNACHSEVTAMVVGSDFDGTRLKWRIVAGKSLKYPHLEHGHFAEVGLCRICAGAQEIPIAFNAATGDEARFCKLLHLNGS